VNTPNTGSGLAHNALFGGILMLMGALAAAGARLRRRA
jgi:LPXTG-motif cell wall-anchored protein